MKINLSGLTLCAAALLAAHAACADAPPTAATLQQQDSHALQSAASVHADFEETDSYPGTYKDLEQRGTVTLSRPGRLRIHIKRFRRVGPGDPWTASGNDTDAISDSRTYTYTFQHPYSTQVSQEAVTDTLLKSALKGLPPLAGFFSSKDTEEQPEQKNAATLLAPEIWEGTQYRVVEYPVATQKRDTLISAHADIGDDLITHRLIYRIVTPQGKATKEWDLRHIALDVPASKSEFAYSAPADAAPLDKSLQAPPLTNGSDAPDFTAYDTNGSPVKLSDYRGKTVVLDFWATWCWPCNQSLPHTEKIARTYSHQGIVVLAVAIWDSKTGFDQWLTKHQYPDIQFARDPRPQGKDTAALYHVTATPTTFVIDGGGRIVQILSGFTGPSPALQSAIESALTAKTAQIK